MKFLHKMMKDLLGKHSDLSQVNIILPGKRPVIFIKEILKENQYSGFMPQFFTIEDLVRKISGKQELSGIALWLFAYQVYHDLYPSEDFESFLKWFPTLLKDWDDMQKFAQNDKAVLDFMLDEERIKIWAENLSEQSETPRNKFLDFWKKMNRFLPELKKKLSEKNWATSGMIHAEAKSKVVDFAEKTKEIWVFAGLNALTPVEEKLVKTLLQWDKALCYFQADRYYFDDDRQEAGKFLRQHKDWKEFNDSRAFNWIENDFEKKKDIRIYEVSGNVSQAKVLPEIFKNFTNHQWSKTAVVLLDENLLPATLETLSMVDYINITMGFPLKNLAFSNAIKQIFYLQKQILKKSGSYYYSDIISILDALPFTDDEKLNIQEFKNFIEERNIIFISPKILESYLSTISCYHLLLKADGVTDFIELLISYCRELKFLPLDDVIYENIAHFEKAFTVLRNQIQNYPHPLNVESLEVLIHQLVNQESIDFIGEPLQGLQVMGLLETRLLNFENIIMLSVNEGKLPLGNTQNTYLPHDVRTEFGLQTFLENDSIYAYHFYRLIQDAKKVSLLFNAMSSGVNTGEKSRFITQLEVESGHTMDHIIIENSSEPIDQQPMTVQKTAFVMQQLEEWKSKVAVSHLNSYLYNPIDFYLNKMMNTKESVEMEEELSKRSYGNLVHFALEFLYKEAKGKTLTTEFLLKTKENVDAALSFAIEKLKHQPEFYKNGMNYIHKIMATKVVNQIVQYDIDLVGDGNSLEIVDLEYYFEGVEFPLDDLQKVYFHGYIDRIDRLNGQLRILDYKTAKIENLKLKIDEKNYEHYLRNKDKKQALQLCIYQFVVERLPEFKGQSISTGIWSFAQVDRGPAELVFEKGNLDDALVSIKNIILEILNPDLDFVSS
ncbi:PD-(D/E)XK nuclease family protein [Amniculibacterium sp. G2-70]|uniref:PD-(D/E)XK nuclease family protein n=1 Tax=Amniculibacterium sp. G2-70 TaxID=2767188 RepID=UPI001654AC76|nr:PD-(D/E)XK nuclease family protein [Amniculibacterium sp. G2-70]